MRPTQRFFAAAALVLIALGIGQVAALRGTDPSPNVAARPDIATDPDANEGEPTPASEEPEEEPTEAPEAEATPTPEDDGEPAQASPTPTDEDDDDDGEQVASSGSGTGSQGAPPPTMPTTGAPVSHWGALGTWMLVAGLGLLSLGIRRRRITQREMWAVISSCVNQ